MNLKDSESKVTRTVLMRFKGTRKARKEGLPLYYNPPILLYTHFMGRITNCFALNGPSPPRGRKRGKPDV